MGRKRDPATEEYGRLEPNTRFSTLVADRLRPHPETDPGLGSCPP
jgi:hypothetical protein